MKLHRANAIVAITGERGPGSLMESIGWRYRSWCQCQFADCEYSTSVEFSLFHISERPGSLLDGDIGVAPNRSQCHSAECGYSTSVECGRPIFSLLHTSTQFLSDCICGFTSPTVSSNPAPNIHYFTLPLTHFRSD